MAQSSVATRKGRLVEEIAAKLHREPGVTVETRAMLSPASGKGRKREIDVLATAYVLGKAVRVAVECKNERKPIDAPFIDAFVGKLTYLGIPTNFGVFVSRSRYTDGAKERAAAAGVTLLNLTGLAEDGLAEAIYHALQSVVYLLLHVNSVVVTTTLPANALHNIRTFADAEQKFCGTTDDLVWRMWRDGKLPDDIAEHNEIEIEVPDDWFQYMDDGTQASVFSVKADLTVIGLVVTFHGRATSHSLVDAQVGGLERGGIEADWGHPDATISLVEVRSEQEVEEHLRTEGIGAVVKLALGRARLPRILTFNRLGHIYWPPSKRALVRMQEISRKHGLDQDPTAPVDVETIDPTEIEGNDINAVWDEVWDGYPSAV
jgi:hypothetical protein